MGDKTAFKNSLNSKPAQKAFNDFKSKAGILVKDTRGGPSARPSIILDPELSDQEIHVITPTTVKMNLSTLVKLDEKLNKVGRVGFRPAWMFLSSYVHVVMGFNSKINPLSLDVRHFVEEIGKEPEKYNSGEMLQDFIHRMFAVLEDGDYSIDGDVRQFFQISVSAYGGLEDLEKVMAEMLIDSIKSRKYEVNICRTCKFCNSEDMCGVGPCTKCRFSPDNTGVVSLRQFQETYGQHVFADKDGCIYTDITTGVEECYDYIKRPMNIAEDMFQKWFLE